MSSLDSVQYKMVYIMSRITSASVDILTVGSVLLVYAMAPHFSKKNRY